jgi:DNA repair exonuclease SbcCD ATPase subunit
MKTADALKKEVEKAAKPYLDRIRELEEKQRHRQQTVNGLKKEASDKLAEAERLENEAQQAMENGEDPKAYLQEASRLWNEAQDLQGFIDRQSAGDEQDKIKELKDDLTREVKKAIQASKVKRQESEALLQAMREVVRISEEWKSAVDSAFQGLGLGTAPRFPLLEFRDDSEEADLAKRIQKATYKHQHLFN